MSQINKKGILALKEEYEKRIKRYQEEANRARYFDLKEERAEKFELLIIELQNIIHDLEELLK